MKKRPCPFCSGEHEHSEDDGCCFCDYTGFVYDEVPEDIGGNITQLQTSEAVFKKETTMHPTWLKSVPSFGHSSTGLGYLNYIVSSGHSATSLNYSL